MFMSNPSFLALSSENKNMYLVSHENFVYFSNLTPYFTQKLDIFTFNIIKINLESKLELGIRQHIEQFLKVQSIYVD